MFVVLLDKTERPGPLSVASLWPAWAWFLVQGVWWGGFIIASFSLDGS